MTEDDRDLQEKLKTLNLEALHSYRRAAINVNRTIDIFAVGIIFTALVSSSVIGMVVAGITSYLLGHVSVGMKQTIGVIEDYITKHKKA